MDPVIDATLRAALALLFLAAAAAQAARPGALPGDRRGLPPPATPARGAGAAILVLSEAATAVALAVARAWGLAGAAALLALYAAAIAVNLARGRRHLDCGCTGPALRRPISGWLVLRNLVLVAIALADLAPLSMRPLVWIDHLTVVAATAAFAACWMATDRLLATAPGLARLREAA